MTGRSFLTNLLETFEVWTKALDDGYGLDVVYLYYRKAFDSVPHVRLIEKLKTYGFKGKLLAWIENFLKSRTMRVELRGVLCAVRNNGCPEWSFARKCYGAPHVSFIYR